MRVILDESAPKRLRNWLSDHEVKTVVQMGWGGIKNGKLLRLIEGQFDVFVTADKNLEYQQNLAGISFGFVILPTNHWKSLQIYEAQVRASISAVQAQEIIRIT